MAGCCSDIEFSADVLCALLQQIQADAGSIYGGPNIITIDNGTCSVRQATASTIVDNGDGSFTHTSGAGVAVNIPVCDLIDDIVSGVAAVGDQLLAVDGGGSCKLVPTGAPGGAQTPGGTPYPASGGNAVIGIRYEDTNTPVAFDPVTGEWEICSPAGGGVPGKPSQFAADWPCPASFGTKVYQTADGLRGVPAHTSGRAFSFRSFLNDQNQGVIPNDGVLYAVTNAGGTAAFGGPVVNPPVVDRATVVIAAPLCRAVTVSLSVTSAGDTVSAQIGSRFNTYTPLHTNFGVAGFPNSCYNSGFNATTAMFTEVGSSGGYTAVGTIPAGTIGTAWASSAVLNRGNSNGIFSCGTLILEAHWTTV